MEIPSLALLTSPEQFTPRQVRNGTSRFTSLSGKRREKKKIEDIYEFCEVLGRGGFGVVRKVKNMENGTMYAVKIIDKAKAGAAGMSEIFSEVEIISVLSHRYIVGLQEVFETKDTLYLVMELLVGGPLESRLRKSGHFSEATTKRYVRNMLLAVEYIHRKGIVHRDLKPANMLMAVDQENSEVKLADFGFAVLTGEDACLSSCCGTTAFMAPEILNGEAYGKAVDMWSIGVIIFYLLSGTFPFTGSDNVEITDNIMKAHYSIPDDGVWKDVSLGAKDIIRKLLVLDSKRRPTAGECLNHTWVRSGAEDDMDLILNQAPMSMGSWSSGSAGTAASGNSVGAGGTGLSSAGRDTLDGDDGDLNPFFSGGGRSKLFGVRMFRAGGIHVVAAYRFLYLQRVRAILAMGITNPIMLNYQNVLWKSFHSKVVDFSISSPIGNRGISLLVEMLSSSPSVETLNLANNDLNFDSVQAVVKLATNHPSLTSLDLSCNPLTQTGGRAILRLARSNHKIRFIGVKGSSLNQEIVSQINASLHENSKRRGGGHVSAGSSNSSGGMTSQSLTSNRHTNASGGSSLIGGTKLPNVSTSGNFITSNAAASSNAGISGGGTSLPRVGAEYLPSVAPAGGTAFLSRSKNTNMTTGGATGASRFVPGTPSHGKHTF